ncbi:GNAT family N-acetyltransferase [Pseudarthrobacter sp. PvP090]|uniref:GNAT family N-acetyltransferase n=1 Tax=Pseudarthrobacter sp. PvP090 TaxID=3156393 RepID=UPI00339956E6
MTAPPYCIERLLLPDALESPDAGNFLEFSKLSDALVLETWGNLDRATPPGARLRYWRDDAYKRMQLFFVRDGGRMVARSWIRYELQENLGSALVHVDVLKDFTGRGIGRTLLAHAEALAAADGRTVLMSFTEHPADFDAEGPDVLCPATGTGALPASARAVRFAQEAGYQLEQVERFSSLAMPPAPAMLDALEREALARAEAYELVTWTDHCPEEYVEQLAVLMSRMSTDAPTGGLSYDEETWDAARVRHVEDTWTQAGNISLVTAARHRDSNELAAYTVLELAPSKPWLADQDDTLVAASHRGHRLGMLVKIRNLRRLLAEYPAVERVNTFNAAENDHMLAINVALGFRAAGYDGEWQRTVDAAVRGS